jgi:hypothetical protein
MDVEDLRDSVRDYRHPATSAYERREIVDWWKSQGIPNQFAAMFRAAELAAEGSE